MRQINKKRNTAKSKKITSTFFLFWIFTGTHILLGCEHKPDSKNLEASDVFPSTLVQSAGAIDETFVEEVVREIASDAYEGRAPGTDGDKKTQNYLIQRLEEMGYVGGAKGGGWIQPFALIGLNTQQPKTWSFETSKGNLTLQQGNEFILASGQQASLTRLENAELVFVGYGIQAPEYGWDDYKGQNVQGKILVMMNNDPDWDPDLFQGQTRLFYGRWVYKYEIAARLGAAGVIIIHTDYSAGYPWQVVQTSWTGVQFELPNEGEPTIDIKAWMTEDASKKLINQSGFDLDKLRQLAKQKEFEPVFLGTKTSLQVKVDKTSQSTANVLAILPGSKWTDEAIIYTAHHDHLGIDLSSTEEDRIYNGAKDNASGVASVLSIAKAFKTNPSPPKRSVLFAFVGAEEQGLLGSAYYARYPTFEAGKIAANINIDSAQVYGKTADISFIGYGRSSIDSIARKVADFQSRSITGDQKPSAGYFYRSDHFSLAKIGVPSLNYKGGSQFKGTEISSIDVLQARYVAEIYHQPKDEIDANWRFDGLVEDAQFGFYAGWLIANQKGLPTWNAGDEFEASRLQAINRTD